MSPFKKAILCSWSFTHTGKLLHNQRKLLFPAKMLIAWCHSLKYQPFKFQTKQLAANYPSPATLGCFCTTSVFCFQRRRPVPVIIPPDCTKLLYYLTLAANRQSGGVQDGNKYLFPNTGEFKTLLGKRLCSNFEEEIDLFERRQA